VQRRKLVAIAAAAVVLLVSAVVLQRTLRRGSAFELDEEAYAAAEAQFAELLAGRSRAAPAGFAVRQFEEPFAGLSVEEPEGTCRGGGTYLLRSGPANLPLLITAPHRGRDRLTGPLALSLLTGGRAGAAAWNNVPRGSDCGTRTSDLARLERHPFTAFAAGFARAFPTGRVVQVHGFDADLRSTAEGRAASIILSSGSPVVSSAVATVAECLRDKLPGENVAVFPTDVSELGARRNAQGRRLREIGFEGFAHVEISLDLRQRLMRKRTLRSHFRACLEAGL
jgi:hypothetical protein